MSSSKNSIAGVQVKRETGSNADGANESPNQTRTEEPKGNQTQSHDTSLEHWSPSSKPGCRDSAFEDTTRSCFDYEAEGADARYSPAREVLEDESTTRSKRRSQQRLSAVLAAHGAGTLDWSWQSAQGGTPPPAPTPPPRTNRGYDESKSKQSADEAGRRRD